MKKIFSLSTMLLLALLTTVSISSCSDDDEGFDYPLESLYGTWKAKEILVDGTWADVTKYPYTKFGMSITFYEDGSFYGTGYFGTGSGTYKAVGKKIITYLNGKEYFTYTVNSLSNNNADLTMSDGSDSMRIRATKQ